MSAHDHHELQHPELHNRELALAPARVSKNILRLGLFSFAALAAAGGIMWLHFGPIIFLDMMAALQSCF